MARKGNDMAYWDDKQNKKVYHKPRPSAWRGWEVLDCGCCNGIEWGGEEPIECSSCNGSGKYFRHTKSGVLAEYPGGPFLGRESKGAAP